MTHVMLVGNPNCGKTTLFNALTGDTQRVGNWPGVTVEKKTGQFDFNAKTIHVTDLPGVYSLVTPLHDSSQDAMIAALAVAQTDVDIMINVVDACHLERHLYLTTQLLELGKPLIIVVNMTDIAKQRGIDINADELSTRLQCPVVMLQANRHIGIDELKQAILAPRSPSIPLVREWPHPVQQALARIEQVVLSISTYSALCSSYIACRVLEGDRVLMPEHHEPSSNLDVEMADTRYQTIHRVVSDVQTKKTDAREHLTAKIDRVVLHRFWALPIFFAMMYSMFVLAINVGGAFQDFFDISTNAVFVEGSVAVFQWMHAPAWLIAICSYGIGKGINTTLTFVPVMASMYFLLSCLEASGYMARAAFVVDKTMRFLGLPGKAFVPMIVGFGCNVPAIMAARTLDSERDRLLTVMMSPFMSCSARLAIYAVFVAAFFPTGGQNVVFSLYLIGILMAILTGFVLRKTLLPGSASPLILELPAYHRPSLRRLIKETLLRLRFFIVRAGKFIVPVCILLGGLNALTVDVSGVDGTSQSILSWLGQCMMPFFVPMGLNQDNWPAAVGLLTGTLAKEVVVGTLNTLYVQMGHVVMSAPEPFQFWHALERAFMSIPQNLAQCLDSLMHPILSLASQDDVSSSVYGVMYRHFDGKAGAYAYLLFILLYVPCVSTMAAIRQEASAKLMWWSIIWSFFVAYMTAVSFYQIATFTSHPQQTLGYLVSAILSIGVIVFWIRFVGRSSGDRYAATNS